MLQRTLHGMCQARLQYLYSITARLSPLAQTVACCLLCTVVLGNVFPRSHFWQERAHPYKGPRCLLSSEEEERLLPSSFCVRVFLIPFPGCL